MWYSKVNQFFSNSGFQRSINEPMVYKKVNENSEVLLLSLYVDDIIYSMLMEFKQNMMNTFEMTDLGPFQYFLGLEVRQNYGHVHVGQKRYAEELLKRAGMLNCKTLSTPVNINEKLQLNDNSGSVDERRYRKIVGGLLYLTHTILDLMFAVSSVTRYMHCPSKHHMGAVKRILHYIAGTLDLGIQYEHIQNFGLIGHVNSDWGGLLDDRRSTAGWVFSLG